MQNEPDASKGRSIHSVFYLECARDREREGETQNDSTSTGKVELFVLALTRCQHCKSAKKIWH